MGQKAGKKWQAENNHRNFENNDSISHRGLKGKYMVLGIGYGNFVSMDKIVAVVSPDSAPIKRLIRETKKEKKLIDATAGHRTRSVLIMDNGHVILSANQPETVVQRCNKKDKEV
jgi:regulator of extracellular matrix RemA (YlzA/DUF370 family)